MLTGQILWVFTRLEHIEFNMASTGRMTCSKGPSDGVSLPPYSRPRNSVYTETGKQEGMTGEPGCQADIHRQPQDTAEWASPFARPSSRASASTTPTNTTQTPSSPFAKDSLTIHKAHLVRLSTVECFHEIIRQQARICLIRI